MRINKMIMNLKGTALISKQILKTNPLSNVWISVWRIFMWILGIKGLDYVCDAGSDLGSASDWSCRVGNLIQPIRSTTQIGVVRRHQYGISALVSQTSFGGETSGSITKCRLCSQANLEHNTNKGKK